ncbi:assimilatory sulfite reductase (NADPH) hemoprotein subunit [uncultured Tolumonas sp.]|uniref:assimilatory sulfite reductase (NADPH) hemoprotein subunit n=1 Tax=uncultured Tolumonas sp. TaxID=263765 RepID=UPI00292F285D|nr:assimilatory sulfite reductase (NADPH) hemoprotein subunit [uncultured Tolumonas sp.]
MSNEKLSDNERLKSDSERLRGTITDDLANPLTGGFEGDNFQLIRFHGMYQQDDRDIRAQRAAQKLEPLHTVMLRVRLPGGIIRPDQWGALDEFATHHTLYGSIRLTNRQTFQFHGVLKDDIKPVHKLLNSLGLDSRGTAGDVNRNVLCTSNPIESALHHDAFEWAKIISEHLRPRTNAYAEIWLDGEKLNAENEEPILGSTYLPRKFKTAIVIPPQNDVDVHANDLSFVAIGENGKLVGFNVLVGGGLAMTQGDETTYPRMATDFGFIALNHIVRVAEAVLTTQRDWGNRSNRRNAKTKYTLERVGIESFKTEVEKRAEIAFAESRPYQFTGRGDRIGWVSGIDGKHHLTLFIPSGRLIDTPEKPLKTGIAELAKIHTGDFRITPNQNMIIAGVDEENIVAIEMLARQYKLIDDSVTEQRKYSMACVSFPTCPLAMAEAERFLPEFALSVDAIMAKYDLAHEHIILRVTGCPNGCGRAMLAEIGLVGRAQGRYSLYLGGNREGTRIPRLFRDNINDVQILAELDRLIGRWALEREADEGFGDFAIRQKIIKPVLNSAVDFYHA